MHYGISTICPSWFRSYITNRYQEVILHQPFTFLFFKSDHGHNNIIYLHIYNDINQILTPKFCKKKNSTQYLEKGVFITNAFPFTSHIKKEFSTYTKIFPYAPFSFIRTDKALPRFCTYSCSTATNH